MVRKKRSQPRNVLLEAQTAAYLYSLGNDQARIKEVLGVSQGEVSRLLGVARREGWLQMRCVLPEAVLQEIEQLVFANRNQLRDRLDREAERHDAAPVRGIRVLPSGGAATDPSGWNLRLERFGRAAAARFQELLPRMHVTGVAWGKTIAGLVGGLRQAFPQGRPPAEPVHFFPITGEPLTNPDPETSSSTLSHRLNEIINGGKGMFHSLAAVPAFVPAKFPRKSRQTIRAFLAEIVGYRAIFERDQPDKPLIDQMDSIITGVGTVSAEASGRLLDDRIRAEGITKDQLAKLVIGDIGGVFVPRSPRNETVRGINERWTGATLADFAGCARAAAHKKDRTGVVVLAIGRAKAQIILECVRLGLVSELIIDHELAQALLGVEQ
jgi:DNA-binding transcriptional regulator LsrR (DeoR family)